MDQRPESLDDPVLIVHLEGWIDAGLGAAAAMATLLGAFESTVIASFDIDRLLDHRARRPVMRLTDGVNTGLAWPELQLRHGRPPGGERDVLVLAGPEPDHLWQSFGQEVAALASDLGVRLAVGLGAFPAPVPHTRPCRLASTATNQELAEMVGYVKGTLDVPAGGQAVLERAFADAGLDAVGLWARVPHYVAAMPYPGASAALLDGLREVAGVAIDNDDLVRADVEARQRIDILVANNPEHAQLVRQLESQVDAEEAQAQQVGFTDVPSGDEIAAELERFLREQG